MSEYRIRDSAACRGANGLCGPHALILTGVLSTLPHAFAQETAKAQAFPRFVVVEGLLPLIKKGEDQRGLVLTMSHEIIHMIDAKKGQGCSAMIAGAASEVKSCAGALVSLLEPIAGGLLPELQTLMDTADRTGYRFLLKTALLQTPFYEKLQTEVMEVSVAESMLMPSVRKALENMQSVSVSDGVKKVVGVLKTVVPEIALWRNKLRAGSTAELEEALAKLVEECAAEAGDEDQLASVIEVGKLYLDVPKSPASRNHAGLESSQALVEKSLLDAKADLAKMKTREAQESLEKVVKAFADTPSAPDLWSSLRKTLEAAQSEHLTEGHSVWIAQTLGKSLPHFMKVCSVAQLNYFQSDGASGDAEKGHQQVQQAASDAMSTVRTLQQYLSSAKKEELKEILAVAEAFQTLTEAYQPLQKHQGDLAKFFSEDKDEGLASMALLSSHQKLVSLKASLTVDGAKFYLNPLEKPIKAVGAVIEELKAIAVGILSDNVKASVDIVTPLAGGGENGASWKAKVLADGASWADIKRQAQALQTDAIKDLFTGFQKLQKDPSKIAGPPFSQKKLERLTSSKIVSHDSYLIATR